MARWMSMFVPALVVAGACSAATSDDHGFTEGAGGGATGAGSTSGATGSGGDPILSTTGAGGSASSGGAGCSEASKLIYMIGQDNQLFSFDPATLQVKSVGVVSCPAGGFETPFSMAVDRQGTAWVLFSDGAIFHVDTLTAACTATSFQPGQAGFTTFGMGFVSDAAGSDAETLYVADYFGSGIAKIDTQTLTLTFVGPYDQLPGQAAELTGTGDARLFGFYTGASQTIVAEIDKASGAILSQAAQPVTIGSGWAFAFWGGDFWLFTSPFGDSQIDQYSPATGTTTTVKTSLGSNIVGAGVSTCAPVTPPS